MKSFFFFICFLFSFGNLSAQVNANSVLTLHKVSTSDMLAIITPNTGSMVFNTDDNSIYRFDGTDWIQLLDKLNSIQSVVLDRVSGYTLATTNNTYFNFPVNSSHTQSIDDDIFEVLGDGTIRVLEDGVYLISAELSTSNLPAGNIKYIIAAFVNGTSNPADIIGYLTRGFVTLNSTDWWGGTGVLTYNLNANDVVRIRYVLNAGGSDLTGRFINISITKIK